MSTSPVTPGPEVSAGLFPAAIEPMPAVPEIEDAKVGERFPDHIVAALEKPLPTAAIANATRGLTSVKPIFITERLSEVFGMGRWRTQSQVIERSGKMVVVRVEMWLLDYPWFYGEAFGGNPNDDLGDAYKGAVSDALGKICAHQLHIARDIYKGDKGESARKAEKEEAAAARQPTKAEKAAQTEQDRATVANPPACEDCKQPIQTYEHPSNHKRYDAADLVKNSQKVYKANLCGPCQAKRAAAMKAKVPERTQ